jgi:hypothetical protein
LDERLVPYKLNQFVIDLEEEKQKIITKIFEKELNFSFLNNNFLHVLNEIESTKEKFQILETEILDNNISNNEDFTQNNNYQKIEKLKNQLSDFRQEIIDEINKYLPNQIICNSQIAY